MESMKRILTSILIIAVLVFSVPSSLAAEINENNSGLNSSAFSKIKSFTPVSTYLDLLALSYEGNVLRLMGYGSHIRSASFFVAVLATKISLIPITLLTGSVRTLSRVLRVY